MQESRKYLLTFDFESSNRTGRLHNLGLSEPLKRYEWETVTNESLGLEWGAGYLREIRFVIRFIEKYRPNRHDIVLHWMPSYMIGSLLIFFKLIFNFKCVLGFRDLWYGNPQPISSIKGRLFNRFGRYLIDLGAILKVHYVVISREMGDLLREKHCAISHLIISTTGDCKRVFVKSTKSKYDLIYTGTFDLQMSLIKLLELESDFTLGFYGKCDHRGLLNYLSNNDELWSEIQSSKGLVVFGVDDKARLNRKIFMYLQTSLPIFYFGPEGNVTYRILRNYEGVFFNLGSIEIAEIINHENVYSRDISDYLYDRIASKLDKNIVNTLSNT